MSASPGPAGGVWGGGLHVPDTVTWNVTAPGSAVLQGPTVLDSALPGAGTPSFLRLGSAQRPALHPPAALGCGTSPSPCFSVCGVWSAPPAPSLPQLHRAPSIPHVCTFCPLCRERPPSWEMVSVLQNSPDDLLPSSQVSQQALVSPRVGTCDIHSVQLQTCPTMKGSPLDRCPDGTQGLGGGPSGRSGVCGEPGSC